jgi:hypothetical protein
LIFFSDGVSPLSTPEGLELLQRYLKSHGRYGGNTPLLYPLYGIAELCQAYCRFVYFLHLILFIEYSQVWCKICFGNRW